MYLFVGKLNYPTYADNECITFVFPVGFALKDPVCVYWQWTVDGQNNNKTNASQLGFITSVTKTNNPWQYYMRFSLTGYYTFEGSVADGFGTLSLKMSQPGGAPVSDVSLWYAGSDGVRVPSSRIFTGKLNWPGSMENETATLIIPGGDVVDDQPVFLSSQWSDKDKANYTQNSTLANVALASNGDVSGTFGNAGGFSHTFTLRQSDNSVVLTVSGPNNDPPTSPPFTLLPWDHRDLRKKKALIVRFGTGTDEGIFKVQDMLFKHLGFAAADIEVSYFDVDPATGPKQCTKGQDPPTATNFRAKFTTLCEDAVADDVRFLFVDAHGTTGPDDESPGEPDKMDEGWILAANDDGTLKEIVNDDWLAHCIRNNLHDGVNLTILTSSCMGGGMLDTQDSTPGILLAGCHESQFNAKALKGMDPWVVAVTTRGVPSYSVLYNDAKSFIRDQIDQGQIGNAQYKGPSPNELKPSPRDEPSNTSHQDPQLVFCAGYIDPEEERFLSPFRVLDLGLATGDATRYPQDEYPHDEL
ncbi:hypothetical protein B0H16DRAFT_1790523 [Mycena metata]|uniref:Uncharacterized protein n=1 Tax=Mycena metata TaxID=1033252 RepID=A0AAD7ML04_9AGAR|nr:hypothetical protein B0H16DRAFT_1790523 [Mycena metata]